MGETEFYSIFINFRYGFGLVDLVGFGNCNFYKMRSHTKRRLRQFGRI